MREFTIGDPIRSKVVRYRGTIVDSTWLKGKGWAWVIETPTKTKIALLKSVVRRDWEFATYTGEAPAHDDGPPDINDCIQPRTRGLI